MTNCTYGCAIGPEIVNDTHTIHSVDILTIQITFDATQLNAGMCHHAIHRLAVFLKNMSVRGNSFVIILCHRS